MISEFMCNVFRQRGNKKEMCDGCLSFKLRMEKDQKLNKALQVENKEII